MTSKTLSQIPPGRKTQRQPTPAENPIHKTIRELGEKRIEIHQQIHNLKREEIRLELQRGIAQGIVNPLPEITLTPEETQATAEFLYWTEGLLFAAQNAVSSLRGIMEIVQNEACELDCGGPEAKHGAVDVRNSYGPLYSAVELLELLMNKLIAISNRVDLAQMELPDRLRETKEVAEKLFVSDFGN